MSKKWNHFMELRALYRLRPSLSYAEFVYGVALLDHADRDGSTYVGPEKIAQETGFSVRHIESAAAEMKRRGLVVVVQPGRRGHRGVVRVSATNQFTEAGNGQLTPNSPKPVSVHQMDSPKSSARFTEMETRNSPKPTSDSSTQISTQKKKRRARKAPAPELPAIPASLDSPAFRTAWEDFKTHRQEKKRPVTPTNARKLLAKLAKWGVGEAVEALDATVTNGWDGVFRPKRSNAANGNGDVDFESAPGPFRPVPPDPAAAARVLAEAEAIEKTTPVMRIA